MVLIRKLLLAFLVLPFFSCDSGKDKQDELTWIGGQIVNPKSDFVVILKDNEVIDTARLDSNNFFKFSSGCMPPGLYSFTHNEYQIFYIEPGDSLMLRVNTTDFDESLTYSGKGSPENNLLIDLFLINEQENTLMPSLYRLPPAEFEKKLDSLKQIRMALYEEYDELHNLRKGFKPIAMANINYDLYSKKELYTSANSSNPNLKPEEYPKNFYAYRDKIEFGNKNLRTFYPYYRFLNRYFDNLAHNRTSGNDTYINRHGFEHNYHKIKVIDSLVKCDTLKNNLLRTSTRRYLINAKNAEEEKRIVETFKASNTNPAHHAEISRLAESTMLLTPGNKIPNVVLVNYENVTSDLHTVVKKPTVLYFWSAQSVKHFKNLHTRAAELKDKYPEYDFIGINTDSHFKKWQEVLRKAGYTKLKEYQLENLRDAEMKLLINSMNKAIILDSKGIILDGHTNLFSPSIEDNLLGYLNM